MSGSDLLILGGSGLLGSALTQLADAHGLDWAATHHHADRHGPRWHRVDLTDPDAAVRLLETTQPAAVINAAYVQRGDDLWPLTAELPGLVAGWTTGRSRFVHVSSDLVFAGRLGRSYTEADRAEPINEYGAAKLAAERAVLEADPDAVCVRTSLLWGGPGQGGPQVRLVQQGDVTFFTDEYRNPIRVDSLAAACVELVARPEITGLLHVAGPQRVNRLTLARALAPLAGVDADSLAGGTGAAQPDRPADVSLDSSLATSLLTTELQGLPPTSPGAPAELA